MTNEPGADEPGADEQGADDRATAMARVDEVCIAATSAGAVPGTAWGVVLEGELVHVGAAGQVSLPDGARPSGATRFRIASMTKSFTAAAVLSLRDEGRLGLDDPIAAHVPAAALVPPTTDAPTITLRHLLSMDSGLATDDPWADRHLDLGDDELDALLARGAMFATSPGTEFEYSNLGFGLLGRAVEHVTGERLRDVVDERLLRPLGMSSTGWDAPPADDVLRDGSDVATGYRLLDGVPAHDGEPLGHGAIAPMGGLWSTVEDLARWVAFLLDAFPARDGADDAPLRRSTRREMQRVWRSCALVVDRVAPTGRLRFGPAGYGAGLVVVEDEAIGRMVAHSGGLPGFGSNMRWVPDRNIGVVALGNVRYAEMAAMTRSALEALADEGHLDRIAPRRQRPLPAPLRDAVDRLVALVNDWDDERARSLFADNVELDDAFDRRAAAAASVRTRCGVLAVRTVRASRDTSATVELTGERADATLTVQLAPITPARVQSYTLAPVVRT